MGVENMRPGGSVVATLPFADGPHADGSRAPTFAVPADGSVAAAFASEVSLDPECGGVRLTIAPGQTVALHPLWLRERSQAPGAIDPANFQRLFEPSELPLDLTVVAAGIGPHGSLSVRFSDGHATDLSLASIAVEAGLAADSSTPPCPIAWRSDMDARPMAHWDSLDDPVVLRGLLAGFFRYGFCLVSGTPREPGSLESIAGRFGYIRDTNFGRLFNVITRPQPVDLAYTGLALAAHADNPYRNPIPGIQLLHCLDTTVTGGNSTLVDGLALAEALRERDREAAEVIEATPVRFRFESRATILEAAGPLIERDAAGRFVRIRFSSRVDYVPPLPPARLALYYRGRQLLFRLAADPAFQIDFRLEPGMAMMMDNHRVLHGRAAFDPTEGHRHLQGCYIDHDGPESLYRVLCRDGYAHAVGREVA